MNFHIHHTHIYLYIYIYIYIYIRRDANATFGYGGIGPTGVYSLHIHNDSRSLLHYWDRHNKHKYKHNTHTHNSTDTAATTANSRQFVNSERHKGHSTSRAYYYESNLFWYWVKYLSGKLKLHACFSGNRWLSSYVPYLTAVSFGYVIECVLVCSVRERGYAHMRV